jgi:hypothetical protein
VEFSITPKPAPNSAIPASTAAGEASQIIAARPAADATTAGMSSRACP